MSLDFSWDPKKAKKNLNKHHVSFMEAITVFEDPYAKKDLDKDDPERIILTGHSGDEHLLMVVHIEYLDERDTRMDLNYQCSKS